MKPLWSAVIAVGLAGAAYADDETTKQPRNFTPAELEAYQDLAQRVLRLEEQQDEELERLKKAAAKEKQEEAEGLPGRVSKLEKEKFAQTWDASKMLSFSTADGNFTAKIGGRAYFVYRHIFERSDAPAGGAPDQFIIDTARIQLDGSFYKDFFYRVEYAVEKNSTANINNDVFLGWKGLSEYFTIQAGQFKVPFSQEETTSSRFIDFAERSILNRLVTGRDQGILVFGTVSIFDWALGAFNGTGKNTADLNDEKDVAARLFISPFRQSSMNALKQLRVGVDVTHGNIDGGVAAADITDGDLGGLTVIDFGAAAFVEGYRTRMDFNFSWLYGPFSLRGEYLILQQDLSDAAPESDFEINAFYVQATFLLTGEDKPLENRVKPKHNFNPLEGGWGAWELAVRFASLDAGDAEDAGLIATTASQEVEQLTIGINWWMTPNFCLRLNWEHLTFQEDLAVKSGNDPLDDSQDIFYVRWQVDF